MYGFEVCEIPIILQIIYFIKILINLIKFIVPMGLIIMVSLDVGKAVISGEKEVSKVLKASGNKILAAIIIFLLPTIVNFSVGLVDKFTSHESCWANANTTTIKEKQVLWDEAVAKREEERKKEQEEQRREEEDAAIKKEEEENSKDEDQNDDGSSSSSSSSSSKIVKISTTDLGCTLYYDPRKNIKLKHLYIRESEAKNLHNALKGACSFANSVSYMSYMQTAGAYVNREGGKYDYHAKALAIDLNNLWSYTTNGKTYHPYGSQGYATWNNYKKFICEVCDGKENCSKNINYIIYERYFKKYGWCWGGNWSPQSFDPMHFEKREGGCLTANKEKIVCN